MGRNLAPGEEGAERLGLNISQWGRGRKRREMALQMAPPHGSTSSLEPPPPNSCWEKKASFLPAPPQSRARSEVSASAAPSRPEGQRNWNRISGAPLCPVQVCCDSGFDCDGSWPRAAHGLGHCCAHFPCWPRLLWRWGAPSPVPSPAPGCAPVSSPARLAGCAPADGLPLLPVPCADVRVPELWLLAPLASEHTGVGRGGGTKERDGYTSIRNKGAWEILPHLTPSGSSV